MDLNHTWKQTSGSEMTRVSFNPEPATAESPRILQSRAAMQHPKRPLPDEDAHVERPVVRLGGVRQRAPAPPKIALNRYNTIFATPLQ